jgi:uncharacterized membrane protein
MLTFIWSLESIFVLSGILLVVFAIFTARDQGNPARRGTACFWFLLGATFALGSIMPAWITGIIVIAMVALDGAGLVQRGRYGLPSSEERTRSSRLGNRVFAPVLTVPVLTIAAAIAFYAVNYRAGTQIFIVVGYAGVLSAFVALAVTQCRPATLIDEGRRVADAVGTAIILPQLLAALGTLFTRADVGKVIARDVAVLLPEGSLLAAVIVYCGCLAMLTAIMGNSFAAFPVILTGIGAPLLIAQFQANPALVGSLGMTVASCGTLCTPMAANFNIVPPALFEMRDRYGVIKFQLPVAAAMFIIHVLLLWILISVQGK